MTNAGSEAQPRSSNKAADVFGWTTNLVGLALGVWSVYNFTTRVKPNELDVLNLLMCLVIAITLMAFGICLLLRRSPWKPLLLGIPVTTVLFVLALLRAAKDFN